MSDLEVSSQELIETGTALRLLSGELRDAETIVQDYRSSIGHRGLAERLDEMQGSWDDRRNELVEGIDGIAEVAQEAGKAFEDIEQHLVAALVGE